MTVGTLRKVTDFFLEKDEFTWGMAQEDVLLDGEEDILEAEDQLEPQGSQKTLV